MTPRANTTADLAAKPAVAPLELDEQLEIAGIEAFLDNVREQLSLRSS